MKSEATYICSLLIGKELHLETSLRRSNPIFRIRQRSFNTLNKPPFRYSSMNQDIGKPPAWWGRHGVAGSCRANDFNAPGCDLYLRGVAFLVLFNLYRIQNTATNSLKMNVLLI